MIKNDILAWHFLPEDRHIRWGTKEEVKVGQTLKVDGPLRMCRWGLHASGRAIDALKYAPGTIACRVRLSGQIIVSIDKVVASERTCLAMIDAKEILRQYTRACALSVIHLWKAPQIVIDYLCTGDESIRAAARAAAWDAAQDAAWGAAYEAARASTYDASRDTTWYATRDAARAAAVSAAWNASQDAAVATTWEPTRATAWHAAHDVTWDAVRDEQNAVLEEYLLEAID